MLDTLRPYQRQGIAGLQAKLKAGYRRIILEMSVGGGKTTLAFGIAHLATKSGGRVLFSAPRLTLLGQTATRAESKEGGLNVFVYHGDSGEPSPSSDFVVTTNQTLLKRWKENGKLIDCSTYLIDEAHSGVAASEDMRRMIAAYYDAGVNIIGLTATPWSKAMGKAFPDLFPNDNVKAFWQTKVKVVNQSQLIESGNLAPCKLYRPMRVDLDKVGKAKDKDGNIDYKEADIAKTITQQVVENSLEKWAEITGGKDKTIVFCPSVDNANIIAQEFIKHGYDAEMINGYMTGDAQRAIVDRFKRGVTTVLVNPLLLREGLDVTDIECVLWLRPTQSEIVWVQAGGRGARPHPGKTHYKMIDCVGTSLSLGFPDDDRDKPLCTGKPPKKKGEDEAKPKKLLECKGCFTVLKARRYPCPECGFKPTLASDVQEYKAYLIEVDRETAQKEVKARTSPSGKVSATKAATAQLVDVCGGVGNLYRYLLYIARERGYKDAWASVKTGNWTGTFYRPDSRLIPIAPKEEIRRLLENCISIERKAYMTKRRHQEASAAQRPAWG